MKAKQAKLVALDPIGQELGEISGRQEENGIRFDIKGDLPGVQYHLIME